MTRIAVLASGGGSNLQAILRHFDALGATAPGTVALVASDRAGAGALERARTRGIATLHLPASGPAMALEQALDAHDIGLVVLAGYLRLVPAGVVRRWRGRLVNIHPALLPSFGGHGMYGHHVHEAVLAHGCKVTGCTAHLVQGGYDTGPILDQLAVRVADGDTPDTLAARVQAAERDLYPRALAKLLASA